MLDFEVYRPLVVDLIFSHRNKDLVEFLDTNIEATNYAIDQLVYEIFYTSACESGNEECLTILSSYGFDVKAIHWTRIHEDEHDNWKYSPLAIAFKNMDVSMICNLAKMGFRASCPHCIDRGQSSTCILYSLFTLNYVDVTINELEDIVKCFDADEVISSFKQLVETNSFENDRVYTVFTIICKCVPMLSNSLDTVTMTRSNKEFIISLTKNGFVDVTSVLESTLNLLMGTSMYNLFLSERTYNIPTVEELNFIMKSLIDLGADTTKVMTLDFSFIENSLPRVVSDPVSIFDRDRSFGSFEDIIRSSIENKSKTLDCTFYSDMCISIFDQIEELYAHVKFRKRLGFISKRILYARNPENLYENIDLSSIIVGVESPVFSEIMSYII